MEASSDRRRAFNFGEFIRGKAQQPMPKSLEPYEDELCHFASLCHGLCIKLLKLFALGLKIHAEDGGEDWFSSRHNPLTGPSGSILRLLHYPAIKSTTSDYDEDIDIRAGAHSDYGSLTLLFQRLSQPGLEILTPESTWASVVVSPPGSQDDPFPPILVNIGDLLSYWTKGLLKSTVHRVVFPEGQTEDRYSIAYFCHPENEAELVAVPSEMVRSRLNSQTGDGRYRPEKKAMTAEEHLVGRLAVTYGWGKQDIPVSN